MTLNLTYKGNKWLSGAIPALLIHCCIGSVYCWSLIKNNIAIEMGVASSQIEFAFSLAIFFLGMSAAFCGRFIEKNVKYSSLISAICFTSGLLLTTVAMYLKSVPLLFLSYGCIMGIGLGIGYLSPVKTLMLWFSEHKGLATGIAISGFGLSKAILSPFIEWCNVNYSIYVTLWTISLVSMFCMLLASALIKKPEGWVETTDKFSLKDVWKTITNPDYIKIYLIFYLNITLGLSLISFEKDLCLTNGIVAVGIISSLTAFFNTLGRFGYSTCSDFLQRKQIIYIVIFASCFIVCSLYALGLSNMAIIAIILLCIINAGYGGGFSTLPTLLQSKFGMKNISTIHGLALSAWAWAGLSGNQLSNFIINKMGMNYTQLIIILGTLYCVALIITLTIKNKTYKQTFNSYSQIC